MGAAFGAATASSLSMKYGRKTSFIICDIISILGLLISLIRGIVPILIAHLISGYGAGLNSTIVPLYINEISPKEISGRVITLF